jgi:outer membrane protein OmpA-like peptidoglycan-associated protein
VAVKPMLGDLELQLVDEIEADQDRVLQQHPVPGLEGDFTTDLGSRSATITLTGAVAGEQVAGDLKALRSKFLAAEPVPFAADISTATRVQNVLVEEIGVRELAGKTQLFEYAFTLREFTPAPAVAEEPPPIIPPPPIPPQIGTLEVEVVVEGMPDVDPDTIVVSVDGTQDDGTALSRTLTNHTRNVWTEPNFPPGSYVARATLAGPPTRQGEIAAKVTRGALTHVVIVIKAPSTPPVAATFVVHFQFDKAFVESCMRPVLAQVAEHAKNHADQKLLIIGHTDLVGTDAYNQALSERRARAVFAMLTSGSDPAKARAEWNELRQTRPTGTVLSLHDSWGRREQQWMLRDLGLYHGNIDTEKPQAEDADLTRAAIQQFQTDHGINPTGVVDDATWSALIDAYLSLQPLAVPAAQLLPNAGASCDGGPLKWLGCGELDPVDDRPDAERRNRRVELLFVSVDHLPADAKQPDTFDLPAPGAVSPRWCLNSGNTTTRACFVRLRSKAKETCTTPDPQRLSRVPAEPGDVLVSGSVLFEDGTPLANTPLLLIAPSGRFLPDEHRSGPLRGWGIPTRTGPDGRFAFTQPQGIGIYTVEVRARVVARRKGEPLATALNNVVCARLQDPASVLDIVVTGLAAAGVKPTLAAPSAIVVRKPGSNPRRQPVRLGVDTPFTGSGTFTRSADTARILDAAVGGTEITFNGVDNVFSSAQLAAGVQLFVEGQRASAAVDDLVLRLALTVDGQPGNAIEAKLTVVALTLDVCITRTTPTADPAPLSAADKLAPGRFVQLALPDFSHERALLLIRPPEPAAFSGDLMLTPVTPGVAAFADEVPAVGQVPVATAAAPQVLPAVSPPADRRAFAEGLADSALGGDTGFLLGLSGIEPEGDRVTMTVGHLELLNASGAVVNFARIGLWDNAFDAAGVVANAAAEANNFAGADTRRFFLRLRDASRSGTGSADVEWRTVQENDDDFFTPTDRRVTLVETAAGSGLFDSRGLLLVTDEDDQNQGTHSGLPAGLPDSGVVRARNQSNHRLRRADVRSRIVSTYPQPGVPDVRVSHTSAVFQRTPADERRVLPLQVFVLRVAPGGGGVVPTTPGSQIFSRDLRVVGETYARLGIEVRTVVAPGTPAANVAHEQRPVQDETVRLTGPGTFVLLHPPVVNDPNNTVVVLLPRTGGATRLAVVVGRPPNAGEVQLNPLTGQLTLHTPPAIGDILVASYFSVGHRVTLINAPAGVNPLSVRFQPVNDEQAIGAANRGIDANTLRVFYTGGLASGANGESWPDVDFAGQAQVGSSFINGPAALASTVRHEIGHVLTNKAVAASGAHYAQPAAPAGNRLFARQNVMSAASAANPIGVAGSKRLWDDPDADGINQQLNIRVSRFVRGF